MCVPSAESSRSVRGLGKGVSGKSYPRLCNARRPRLEPGIFRSQTVRLYRLHQARPSRFHECASNKKKALKGKSIYAFDGLVAYCPESSRLWAGVGPWAKWPIGPCQLRNNTTNGKLHLRREASNNYHKKPSPTYRSSSSSKFPLSVLGSPTSSTF